MNHLVLFVVWERYVPRVVITANISLVSQQIIQISQNILPFSLLNTIFQKPHQCVWI